jgi:type IV pilus assembly protein PilA
VKIGWVVVGALAVVAPFCFVSDLHFGPGRDYRPEIAAIAAIRTIHTAEVQYYSQFGHYACGESELASAHLIETSQTAKLRKKYEFKLTCEGSGYRIETQPRVFPKDGTRTFFSDQTMTVHEHYGPEPATVEDGVLK